MPSSRCRQCIVTALRAAWYRSAAARAGSKRRDSTRKASRARGNSASSVSSCGRSHSSAPHANRVKAASRRSRTSPRAGSRPRARAASSDTRSTNSRSRSSFAACSTGPYVRQPRSRSASAPCHVDTKVPQSSRISCCISGSAPTAYTRFLLPGRRRARTRRSKARTCNRPPAVRLTSAGSRVRLARTRLSRHPRGVGDGPSPRGQKGAAMVARIRAVVSALLLVASASGAQQAPGIGGFRVEQVMGYAFPSDLTAAPAGDRIAWSSVQRGVRNIWIAKGPEFEPRMLTSGRTEDGQELTNLACSADGRYLVWTRGGDHGSNWTAEGNLVPNPTSNPVQPKLEIWAAPVDGAPKLLAEGDMPAPSPRGDVVAFEKGREIWSLPLDGSRPASPLFFARGDNSSPTWSPDGKTLAFITSRGAHSYIALYSSDAEPIRYLAPSTSQDAYPVWSPDG
ncbi:MAG: hypothetical protein EHM24_28860, partial [Acidobacteria bacterium]